MQSMTKTEAAKAVAESLGLPVHIITGFDLTPLECDLLGELFAESDANGHDFGLVECLSWNDKQQLGGLLTSLQSKGVVTYIEKTDVNGEDEVTQFGLHDRLTGRNEIPGGEL